MHIEFSAAILLWNDMILMTLQVQKVVVSRCSYTQKADENAAMQNKASPLLVAQPLKNYQEKKHQTQVQHIENQKREPRTLHIRKNGVRSRWRSRRDESYW
jgi:hypothetical protein